MDVIPGVGNKRQYWIRPNMAIWESTYTYTENGEWSTELFGTKSQTTDAKAQTLTGYIYRIQFWGNPGALMEPQIEVHLDGKRPTLQAGSAKIGYGASTNGPLGGDRVITKVWTDGQQGEDNDYFSDHCDGVQGTISWTDGGTAASVSSGANPLKNNALVITAAKLVIPNNQKATFKRCLGDADFDTTNNVGIEDWDKGSKFYPHIVKMVRSVTTYTDGGFYVALYFDDTDFILINPFYPPDELITDNYEIYTTTATLALTSKYAEASFGFASKYIFTSRTAAEKIINSVDDLDEFDGDLSCEVARTERDGVDAAAAYWRLGIYNGKVGFDGRYPGFWSAALGVTPSYLAAAYRVTEPGTAITAPYYVEHCLNKSDMITFLNYDAPASNPSRINLYTTQRIFRNDYVTNYKTLAATAVLPGTGASQKSVNASLTDVLDHHAHYMTRVITTDLSTNWAASPVNTGTESETFEGQHIYKFFPSKKSTYKYVAPCSNRGICDTTTGLCQCFPGYTSDACSEQSSLAI